MFLHVSIVEHVENKYIESVNPGMTWTRNWAHFELSHRSQDETIHRHIVVAVMRFLPPLSHAVYG